MFCFLFRFIICILIWTIFVFTLYCTSGLVLALAYFQLSHRLSCLWVIADRHRSNDPRDAGVRRPQAEGVGEPRCTIHPQVSDSFNR